MRVKTRATSAAVWARYGTALRFFGSLTIPSTAGSLSLHLFDVPGPKRVYAWLDPSSDEAVVVEHCAGIGSPHEAVLAVSRRSGPSPLRKASGPAPDLRAVLELFEARLGPAAPLLVALRDALKTRWHS
jgi:hypothetical protein